jgi:hypothetical protein
MKIKYKISHSKVKKEIKYKIINRNFNFYMMELYKIAEI